jgi:hypothetical protein
MNDSSMPTDVPPPMPAGSPGRPSWTPDGAVSFGWRMVKKDPMVVGVIFLAILCSSVVSSIGSLVSALTAQSGSRDTRIFGYVIEWGLFAINLPIEAFFAMGMWRFLLKTARGEPAGVGDLFTGGPIIAMFGAFLLNMICVLVGIAACIVPGAILALGWQFFTPLLLEKGLGSVDALRASWRLTTGHKGQLCLLWLFSIALALLGLLACCVGVFVSVTIIQLAHVWVYLKLTGQNVVEPPA